MPETRHFCPHCEEKVSLSTLHRHKQVYFDEKSRTWTKLESVPSDSEPEQDLETYSDYFDEDENDDSSEDDFAQLKTCFGLLEEDKALVAPSVVDAYVNEDGDIDDGEVWEDAEETDIDYDLEPSEDCGSGTTTSADARASNSESEGERDEHFCKAYSIATFLSVAIAKWSYVFNITQGAVNALLKLICLFFSLLSSISPVSSSISLIFSIFPQSTYKLKNFLHIQENNFIKYIVCPSCHSLYRFEECFNYSGQQRTQPKQCSFIAYPEHPHLSRRLPCGERLLSEITLKSGKKKYYPRKYYCYKPICDSLASLVKRKGFLRLCELWRLRKISPNTFCDIYDRQVWKDFQYINGLPFLAVPHNLALMLNIDWFTPYKHSPYSIGAIYLVITNLPRFERFKKENILLVGLVPGPSEPSIHMNTYLNPLIDELQTLWTDGISVNSPDFGTVTIKAALICCACDIPACRKVLGFCGHMSKQGCSKCTKEFTYNVNLEKIDFGGFDECPLRTEEDHREQAFRAMDEKSQSSREKIEKKYGSRFTSFMYLPYFDCVRFHVIDPMHNLFLGTSKYIMKSIWLSGDSSPLIDKKDFVVLQERVDNCIVPYTMGRIPHKIASSFMAFTADQWKSWTNVFSLYALHGIVEGDHLKCWHIFVQACNLLTTPMISREAAEEGHRLLLDFCTHFENLYGSHRVTPNMHLHTHLVDCIKDYGPVYSFWLFSFERYNGLLGNFKSNQRSVELQLMRRFLTDVQIYDLQLPDENIITEELGFLLASTAAGTLGEVSSLHGAQHLQITSALKLPLSSGFPMELWTLTDTYHLGGVKSFQIFSETETGYLSECYKAMYLGAEYGRNISSAVYKYSQFKIANEIFGSQGSRSERSSYILAKWCSSTGAQIENSNLRPARVLFYFKHSISINNSFRPHFFAFVEWFRPHASKHILGTTAEVWCHDLFEPLGPTSYLPLQRIESKFVAAVDKLQRESVLIVMPLQRKTYL